MTKEYRVWAGTETFETAWACSASSIEGAIKQWREESYLPDGANWEWDERDQTATIKVAEVKLGADEMGSLDEPIKIWTVSMKSECEVKWVMGEPVEEAM